MNTNPMMILQAIQNGANPMQMMQQMMMQGNPMAGQAMNLMQGKNADQLRQTAYNLAKERGIDLNQFAQSMGVTLPR